MEKTVTKLLNAGIKEVELQSINDGSMKVLDDFYRHCYLIDELKDMPSSKEKYDRSFSCYNLARMKGTLTISINDNDEINVRQYNDNLNRNAIISNGVLILEEISGMDYDADINSVTKELLLSQTGGQITIKNQYNNGQSESKVNKFLYDKTCKTLTYTSNTGTYVDNAESIEKVHDIVYGFFKKK